MNPKSLTEDPTELARPSGFVTTSTTGVSAETESGTQGGEAPMAKKEAIHADKERKRARERATEREKEKREKEEEEVEII